MASLYPAMKGRFGTTEYYVTTMKARHVARQLVTPKQMPGWNDSGLEQRFNRGVNHDQVRKHLAPYLMHDGDRFFGPLIVSVLNAENLTFEDISDFVDGDKIHKHYESAFGTLGYVTLTGSEMLVPLDGQHRLAAIKLALTSGDERQGDTAHPDGRASAADDDVSLILIKHHPEKTKNIFKNTRLRAK